MENYLQNLGIHPKDEQMKTRLGTNIPALETPLAPDGWYFQRLLAINI
ncbi:MAG: hypothetical protein IJX47_07815 [Clostridia bacterium]|nr:hypothetical protein [Clostridia bacterium]